jgi:hypothetical protein
MQSLSVLLILINVNNVYSEEPSNSNNIQAMSTQPIKSSATKDNVLFKRLFTTPRQRQILDDWRARGGLKQSKVSGVDENKTNAEAEQIIDSGQPVKLSGILLRADGKNAIWLNGALEKTPEGSNVNNIRGNRLQSATIKVPLRSNESGAILKPGQVWMPDGQKVEESYQLIQPKPSVEVAPITSPDESNTHSSAAPGNNAPSSSANSSEMPPNAEPKASAKPK